MACTPLISVYKINCGEVDLADEIGERLRFEKRAGEPFLSTLDEDLIEGPRGQALKAFGVGLAYHGEVPYAGDVTVSIFFLSYGYLPYGTTIAIRSFFPPA